MQSSSKKALSDLAINGGPVTFATPKLFGRPNLPDLDGLMSELQGTLSSGWLSNGGPKLAQFEGLLEDTTGATYCVATDNGTAALQLTARALGMRGRVIVPSFTFVATAHALKWQHIEPVFVDVDPISHCIDVAAVEAHLQNGTIDGVCGVHLWGNLCNTSALAALSARYGVPVFYDAAHALACTDSTGIRVGNHGSAEIISFHATKFINACEGGAILTNDRLLAERLRRLRNFGFDDAGDSQMCGVNAKLSELGATVGLHSLRHLDRIVATNRRNLARYRTNLRGLAGIRIVAPTDPDNANCQYVVADVAAAEAGVTREQLMSYLRAEGVLVKAYFTPPCHQSTAYRNTTDVALPVTEDLAGRLICLPTGLAMSPEDVDKICELIHFIVRVSRKNARIQIA